MIKKGVYCLIIGKKTIVRQSRCRHVDTCKYRSTDGVSCDYLIKEGHMRGCDPAHCDKYEPKAVQDAAL